MENRLIDWSIIEDKFGYTQDVERPHVGDLEHIGCGVFVKKAEPNGELIWMEEQSN